MADTLLELERVVEGRVVRFAERPITFAQFLELAPPKEWLELVGGVIMEKPMVPLDHELAEGWLYSILRSFAEKHGMGIVLSSRIMVEVNAYSGRLPDLLFVRQDRREIVQQKAVRGAPDLVIEILSPNDRLSDLRALEADYCTLGVSEIVFIDLRNRSVRRLHKQASDYEEQTFFSGPLTFETIPGLTLQVEWILQEPRPDIYDTLTALFTTRPGAG